MPTACPAVGYACAISGYWRMERHSPGTTRSPAVSDASPDTDCPGRACARTIVPGEQTSFPGGQRSIMGIRLHRPNEPRMTESQYAHCQSDAIRGCEARALRRQGTDGGKRGARAPVPCRQAGRGSRVCSIPVAVNGGACAFSLEPDSRAARWEGRLSRQAACRCSFGIAGRAAYRHRLSREKRSRGWQSVPA